MNQEEFNEFVQELRDKGFDDNMILNVLLESVIRGEATMDDLCLMAAWINYEINVEKATEIIESEKKRRGLK